MEWSKIKNIILLILLTLNLILLIIVGDQQYQSVQVAQNTRFQVLQILSENGVTVSEEVIPDAASLPVLQIDRAALTSQEGVDLLGIGTEKENTGGRVVYCSAKGEMELYSNGRFLTHCTPGAFPVSGGQEAAEGRKALEEMGLSVRFLEEKQENGVITVTYCQMWDGVPVFDALCSAVFEDGSLQTLSGQRITGTSTELELWPLPDVPTTLIQVLYWKNEERLVFSSITSMEAGYQSSTGRSSLLAPVWCITTETGRYVVDTEGNIEALEPVV